MIPETAYKWNCKNTHSCGFHSPSRLRQDTNSGGTVRLTSTLPMHVANVSIGNDGSYVSELSLRCVLLTGEVKYKGCISNSCNTIQ